MKFSNWTPKDLEKLAALLPSSSLMNPHNQIRIWGEIHVDNSEPIITEGDTYLDKKIICGCTGLECIKCVFGACGFRREEEEDD